MKTCAACFLEKDDNDFAFRNKSKGGARVAGTRQSWCRLCRSTYDRKRYISSDEQKRVRRKNDVVRKRDRDFVDVYLSQHPCVDCGESDTVVLDFDHVRGDKKFSISKGCSQGVTLERLVAEIAKCDVRCACCHRRITHIRREVAQQQSANLGR